MNTDLITERTTEMSPRFQPRLAGAIAWITTTSAFAIFVRAKLVVSVDAAGLRTTSSRTSGYIGWAF